MSDEQQMSESRLYEIIEKSIDRSADRWSVLMAKAIREHAASCHVVGVISEHHKTLYGNGKPGLHEEVATLKTVREEDNRRGRDRLIVWGLIISAINLATVLMALGAST